MHILAYPDSTSEFILDTDANDFAMEAVLFHVFVCKERVIAYASLSKTLVKTERKYCVTRKELYSLFFSLNSFVIVCMAKIYNQN